MTETITKQQGSTFNRYADNEIDLREILNLIKREYKIIVLATLLSLLVGIFYAETRSPVYRSTAMIQVNNGSFSQGIGGGRSAMISAMDMSPANVESVLLKSPYVLNDVVNQMGLDISISPIYKNFFDKKITEFKNRQNKATIGYLNVPDTLLGVPFILIANNNNQYILSAPNGHKILTGYVGRLAVGTYLSESIQIMVTAIHADSGKTFQVMKLPATSVASDLAKNFSIKEEGNDTGVLSLSYTSNDRDSAQKFLNKILTVAVAKNVHQKSEEASKMLQFLSDQLPTLKNQLDKSQKTLSQYGFKSGVFDAVSEAQILKNTLDHLQTSLEEVQFQKMMLLQKFTSVHPVVITATKKENQLVEKINQIKEQLERLPGIGQKEASLQADTKTEGLMYAALLKNIQEMEFVKAGTISSVQILSPASYPVFSIPVEKRNIVFGSIILGMVCSLSFIFLRYILSPVVDDPTIVEEALGVPVSAIIPYSQKQMLYNKTSDRNKNLKTITHSLLALECPKDISIEGIRSLRTAIQICMLDAKNSVIAITGCSPSVGKSFISSNLAVLIADLGKRVLIIDVDIRLGRLFKTFGVSKVPGLATFLEGKANINQIVQTVIPNKLDVITTGIYPENPSELLSLKAFSDLVENFKASYDVIILDTSPILAVTDPALVLRHSAINLIVLGVGKDQIKEVQHAKNILEKSGVSLTGIVLNQNQQQKIYSNNSYGKYNYNYAYDK